MAAVWSRFWFAPIPTHSYALLRILFGILSILELLGLADINTFWAIDGMVPEGDSGLGFKAFVDSRGFSWLAAPALYFLTLAAFVAMTVGFQTELAITASVFLAVYQTAWNALPLSGAHGAVVGVLFCLLWANCSSVWSLDAWLQRRRSTAPPATLPPTYPIAPLRLVRFQIALIYLSAGLWKFNNPFWRDGTALHYVLNNNVFRRFPLVFTPEWERFLTIGTYVSMFWEIGFAFGVLFKPTRKLFLLSGIAIHLGMIAGLEIGLFSVVMVSSYVAFLDPHWVASLPREPERWRIFAALARRLQSTPSRDGSTGGTGLP